MKKFLIFLLPLAMIGIHSAGADVYVQNDQQYIGQDGTLHVVGEVQNDSNIPLNQIDIQISLYTDDNEIIEVKNTKTALNTIMPGMKSPFELVITDQRAKIAKYHSLDLDYGIAEPKDQVIEITSSEFSRDKFDNFIITGTVSNKGQITANMIEVIATLYDRAGNVITISEVKTEQDFLRVGEETFFLISIQDKFQSTQIVDYSLVAQSDEYTAVPEFPVGSILLLAGSVSSYVILTRYSRKVITNLVCVANPK